MKIRSV